MSVLTTKTSKFVMAKVHGDSGFTAVVADTVQRQIADGRSTGEAALTRTPLEQKQFPINRSPRLN